MMAFHVLWGQKTILMTWGLLRLQQSQQQSHLWPSKSQQWKEDKQDFATWANSKSRRHTSYFFADG